MQNSKLIVILSKLNAKEYKLFKQYLASFSSSNADKRVALLKIFDKTFPKFDSDSLLKEKLGAKLFKEKKDKIQQVRYLFSDITKHLEQFLIENELNTEAFQRQFFLAKAYRRLSLGKLQNAAIKTVTKTIEEKNRRDGNYFMQKHNVVDEVYKHIVLHPQLSKVELLQKKMNYLDAFYLIEKLKCICEVVNDNNVRKTDYETQLFEEIQTFLKDKSLEENPALNIYYCVLQTCLDKESYFHKLKILLKNNIAIFNPNELDELYIYARNFCIRKCNEGKSDYLTELFTLYKDMLETKVIFRDNYLDEWDFKNIISMSCKLGDFEYANSFIEKFKDKLRPELMLNAYTFGKAFLSFESKNYDATIEFLQQVQFTKSYYHLDTKVLLVKSYFEQDEIVTLFSLIESFKVLLSRNKTINERYKKAYLTFIKIVKKLVRKKLGSKIDLKKVLTEIESTQGITEVMWLKEKIKEME